MTAIESPGKVKKSKGPSSKAIGIKSITSSLLTVNDLFYLNLTIDCSFGNMGLNQDLLRGIFAYG